MEQEKFSPPGANPGMYGSDRDAFLRVWQRVMPEERPDCPVVVERGGADTPPVRTARDTGGDDFPVPEDVPCLGRAGESERERLQDFTQRELAAWQAYRALSRRAGQGSCPLAAMAEGCRRRAKRLSAALFLISGVRFWPSEGPAGQLPRSYLGALREHFLAEQGRGEAYRAAAEECQDACLCGLYMELSDECAQHACRIRSMLERM